MTDRPHDHPIGLYLRMDDAQECLVGTARTMDDVPRLLRGIAEFMERRDWSAPEVDLDDLDLRL